MDFKQIQELIRMLAKSNISEFKYEQDNVKLSIRTNQYVDARAVAAMQQQHYAPMTYVETAPIATMQPAPLPAATASPESAKAAADSAAAAKTASDESRYVTIKSPMVGTFYRSSAPGKPVFVKPGDEVAAGQVVCIIEAMKLFNEIESDVKGNIVRMLVDDATPVEYDQPLFLVDPS